MDHRLAFLSCLVLTVFSTSCKEYPDPGTTTEIRSVELTNITEEDPPIEPPAPGRPSIFPPADSISFKKAWDYFVNAIISKDGTRLINLSLPVLHCLKCLEDVDDNGVIEPETMVSKLLTFPELASRLKNAKFRPHQNRLEDESDPGRPGYLGANVTIYEQIVQETDLLNSQPADQSGNMIFQFVKVKDGFKFYGMFSVPRIL